VSEAVDAAAAGPLFLRLMGHPLRWRLLRELAVSDRQVHELVALAGQPQNLVSYHLGRLRTAGLVSSRRSSADRRDAYYTLDLPRCGQILAATGAALHPTLRLSAPATAMAPRIGPRVRVLFLCTGNSARSQMGEALLRHLSGGAAEAFSAGSHPKSVHPHAVAVLAEQGIDLGAARAKHLDELAGQRFGQVITLCDRIREICPRLPGYPQVAHWSIPDPAREPEGYPAFKRTATQLRTRIGFLMHRPTSTARRQDPSGNPIALAPPSTPRTPGRRPHHANS
jgi:protein-tyrosine-phosphatase/DNA-binding transcriptional ArsR family regulator